MSQKVQFTEYYSIHRISCNINSVILTQNLSLARDNRCNNTKKCCVPCGSNNVAHSDATKSREFFARNTSLFFISLRLTASTKLPEKITLSHSHTWLLRWNIFMRLGLGLEFCAGKAIITKDDRPVLVIQTLRRKLISYDVI